MKSKNKEALNRFAVAVLSMSIVIPSVVPAAPVFAREALREQIPSIHYDSRLMATPSEAVKETGEELQVTDSEITETEVRNIATPNNAVPKKNQSTYPPFGTGAFWKWLDDLMEEILGDSSEDDYETAMENLKERLRSWHETIAKENTADSEAQYPAFDDDLEGEGSQFWDWFYEHAVTLDEDGNATAYKNDVIFDWISHAKFPDAFSFLMLFRTMGQTQTLSAVGNLWPDGYGMNGNLYQDGNGTEESPYIIDSVEDLRTLAVTIAGGSYNEGTYYLIRRGTYDLNGAWIPIGFQRNSGQGYVAFRGHLAAEEGANIKNIGFKANSNLGITAEMAQNIRSQRAVGFFGEIGSGATITNLYLSTSGNTLEGTDFAGILAGHAVDASIKECTVNGIVKGRGYVGGIVGFAESSTTQKNERNMIIEDCRADKVAAYTVEAVKTASEFCGGHSCVGGIAGFAANTTMMDTYVSTNTGAGNHIYGNGSYVGGIVGVMENSDVYQGYVYDGEIGSSNAYAVGGLVGGYDGGQIKVGRFSATTVRPTSTNNYEACFIGTRVNGAGFTYGALGDIAYLFADTAAKANQGICGSRVEDDGTFDGAAHIGYWHKDDNYYTIVSGQNVNHVEEYFYKELESGILNIKKTGEHGETINHFTADQQGKPTRGYLLAVVDPTVDGTKAASVSAYISGSYKPVVTSKELGAFAPGDVVYLSFQDMADGTGYFQMDDTKSRNPWYSYHEKDPFRVYQDHETTRGVTKGAGYSITMPESDVTLGAVYKKVSQSVAVNPAKIVFEVTQIRTGSRENANIEWQVTAYNGNKDASDRAEIITDANGNRWENKTIMTVDENGQITRNEDALFWLNSLVNGSNNDKFNLSWKTGNDKNHGVISNTTPGEGLTNAKKAYFTLNLEDSALAEKAEELAKAQKDGGYKDSMTTSQPYWYHSVITALAQTTDSEDQQNPPKGYADIDIKFHIKDKTNVSLNGVGLSKNSITYDVVRTLSGSRANPSVSYTINGKAPNEGSSTGSDLTAAFHPDYFSSSQVSWYLSRPGQEPDFEKDKNMAVAADKNTFDDGTIQVAVSGTGDKAYYHGNVTLKGMAPTSCSNAMIAGIVKAQDEQYTSQLKAVPDTLSTYETYVKVTGEDANNHSVTDTCRVSVNFKTVDKTEIMPEELKLTGGLSVNGTPISHVNNMHGYHILYTFDSSAKSQVKSRDIYVKDASNTQVINGQGETFTAQILPQKDNTQSAYQPYDKTVVWSLANGDVAGQPNLNPYDVLDIDSATGKITVRGYGDSKDSADLKYSPWVQDQISKGNLDGVTVKIQVVAMSARDNSLVQTKPIEVTFTAASMSSNVEKGIDFDIVLTKEAATGLSGTEVTEKENWSGTDARRVSAKATGTSESPEFSIYDKTGTLRDNQVISLTDIETENAGTSGMVSVKTDTVWIKEIIENRRTSNTGNHSVIIKAKTTKGDSVAEIPVNVKFRYDGVDLTASTVSELPEGYAASPAVITQETPENTYDRNKASVKDRQIAMDVVVTQGNYSMNNPGTRKWSYGIVKLENTTYTRHGVKEDDAVYELGGAIKDYCKMENGYLVPMKGHWEDLISSGKVKGTVSGILTAKKEIDGKSISDSYKVSINFRYDKAVLESHEETFDVVCTQDSRTNSVKSHWTGDHYIQLKARISDENGKDVTPVWESSDESVATVDADGRVYVKKDTWMKEIIDGAKHYGTDVHSGTRAVVITAKDPHTGATADSCQVTVNFLYDQAILDKNEEIYNLVLTQTSRTNQPAIKWSGNGSRKLNAKLHVEAGKNRKPYWSTEDEKLITVDDAGNILPVIHAQWQKAIVSEGNYSGQKKVAVHVQNEEKTLKDSCNVILNFQYENVELSENAKTMEVTITASGSRSAPVYTVTGAVSAKVSGAIHSFRKEESKVVFSSGDNTVLTVDKEGNIRLVLPTSMNGSGFTGSASSLIKEAITHPWTNANPHVTAKTVVITGSSEDGRMADQCNVKLNVKYLDNTYTPSSGGGGRGGSSGGGGGSSSRSTTPSGNRTSTALGLPSYVVKGGTWVQDSAGNWFYSNERTYTDEWAAVQNPYADKSKGQPLFDWFHFGKDSVMTVGWYTDKAGDTYYLHPISDNTLGHMYTGWNWIDDNGDGIAECYYFETQSNGYRGRLYKSTTTPDGYTVNEKGQWMENGKVATKKLNP